RDVGRLGGRDGAGKAGSRERARQIARARLRPDRQRRSWCEGGKTRMRAVEMPPTLALYRAAMSMAQPFAGALLAYRARRGKEDLARADERRGYAARPRPEGSLVWLH